MEYLKIKNCMLASIINKCCLSWQIYQSLKNFRLFYIPFRSNPYHKKSNLKKLLILSYGHGLFRINKTRKDINILIMYNKSHQLPISGRKIKVERHFKIKFVDIISYVDNKRGNREIYGVLEKIILSEA